MHQRAWLSILTFPVVAAFTYPVVFRHSPTGGGSGETKQVSQDPLAGLSDIQDVLSLVRDNYVDVPDMAKVIDGGIQASLERAHPLNSYLSADELRLPDPGPASVGMVLLKRDIVARVMHVVPGSPAAKAGIQVGDIIRKLDGQSVGAFTTWSMERKLRGPVGSELAVMDWVNSNGQLKKINLKREMIQPVAVSVRSSAKGHVVGVPDLAKGRAAELKALIASLDPKLPLVLDLRGCSAGDLTEAALVAGLFSTKPGTFVTVQEPGKPDQSLNVVPAGAPAFSKVAILVGSGTIGVGEALASYLKKNSDVVLGERTAALGVERTRILLKQGGAVELVNRRYLGAGGEKLDRQGVAVDYSLRGLQPDEDPLPKVLDALEAKSKPSKSDKVASLHPSLPMLLALTAQNA